MSRVEELRGQLRGIADDLYAEQLGAIVEHLQATSSALAEILETSRNNDAHAATAACAAATARVDRCAGTTAEAASDLRSYAEFI